jgi:predicted metal-binding membrane protein
LLLASAFPGGGLTLGHGRLCGTTHPGAGALSGFLVAWLVMIAAMMLPDVVAALVRRRDPVGGVVPLTSYVAGYLGPWIVFGIALFVAGSALQRMLDAGTPFATGDSTGGAAVLGVLACGQFASAAFVRRVRASAPASAAEVAPVGALAGIALGWESVRCCWAVMAYMVAAKMHDPPSLAAFTLLIAYQRHGRWGCSAARALGIAALADAFVSVALRVSPL